MFKDSPEGQTQYEPAAPDLSGIEPVAWVTGGDCYTDGHIDCYAWTTGEFTTPLYSVATVERLVQERDDYRAALEQYVNVVSSVNDPNDFTPKIADEGYHARNALAKYSREEKP